MIGGRLHEILHPRHLAVQRALLLSHVIENLSEKRSIILDRRFSAFVIRFFDQRPQAGDLVGQDFELLDHKQIMRHLSVDAKGAAQSILSPATASFDIPPTITARHRRTTLRGAQNASYGTIYLMGPKYNRHKVVAIIQFIVEAKDVVNIEPVLPA
jgi:hypothetical protein